MKNKKLILLIVIVFISIGFAFLTANLTINGNVKFADSTFNVYLDNVELKDSTATNTNLDLNNDKNVITVSATLQKPGDNFKFSFNVINGGTIEAVLDNFTVSGLPDNLKNYFTYTLTYDFDKSTVSRNDILYAGQARKINFNIEYNYDIDSIPEVDNLSLEIRLNYINPKKLSKTTEWNYSYSGTEQIFYVPETGTYKLETWGAQGGSIDNDYRGGYGGYSVGEINLNKDENLYINVGGQGDYKLTSKDELIISGGYNGGGPGSSKYIDRKVCGGGGATHIGFETGLLSTFENKVDKLLIVSGGGAGSWYYDNVTNSVYSGDAGGYIGNSGSRTEGSIKTCPNINADGGRQDSAGIIGDILGTFGQGAAATSFGRGGSGGGFYGGNSSCYTAGGGSSYIANSLLKNKSMYCYNCEQSSETNTKTISTNNISEIPTSQYAKIGNGYARITLLN